MIPLNILENVLNKAKQSNCGRVECVELIRNVLNKWREYSHIKESKEIETDEQDKELIGTFEESLNFLNMNIEKVIKIIKEEKKFLEIFPILENEKGAEFLFESLLIERNKDFCGKMVDVLTQMKEIDSEEPILWFEDSLTNLSYHIEKIASTIRGRNANYFWEVVEKMRCNDYKEKLYRKRIKEVCGIKTTRECMEFIPPEEDKYFLAYPFSNRKVAKKLSSLLKNGGGKDLIMKIG